MTGKHATDEYRRIAESGEIFRCLVGSEVHGISVSDADDRDEMGITVEPPEYVIGLRAFEQYYWHSAWERPGGERNRSGPGDLDICVYSLRKYVRLLLKGNPNILIPLFAPAEHVMTSTPLWQELAELARGRLISRQAGQAHLGYLLAQKRSLMSRDGKGRDVTRPELVARYGFDTKFAGHMIRLGWQGCELMETGSITLPMPPAQREFIVAVRTGQLSLESVLAEADLLEARLKALLDGYSLHPSPLPEHPDRDAADAWLVSAYRRAREGRDR